MTTLDPVLHELRSKELSFGCFYSICKGGRLKRYLGTRGSEEFVRNVHYNVYSKHKVGKYVKGVILGHPLTLGRIWKLGYDKFTGVGGNIINTMQCIMNDVYIMGLADQNELQRMQHPKRPELRELLIKFAEYI